MKRRVNMKLIPTCTCILRLLTIFFLLQGTTMNKDIPINEASGVGVHIGHIQTTHYSSEGEDKRMYTFCIAI